MTEQPAHKPFRTITEKDREYMRRLGEFKAETNADRLRQHLARSGRERLAISERMSRRGFGYANIAKRSPDEPWKLHERARELGIYKA